MTKRTTRSIPPVAVERGVGLQDVENAIALLEDALLALADDLPDPDGGHGWPPAEYVIDQGRIASSSIAREVGGRLVRVETGRSVTVDSEAGAIVSVHLSAASPRLECVMPDQARPVLSYARRALLRALGGDRRRLAAATARNGEVARAVAAHAASRGVDPGLFWLRAPTAFADATLQGPRLRTVAPPAVLAWAVAEARPLLLIEGGGSGLRLCAHATGLADAGPVATLRDLALLPEDLR